MKNIREENKSNLDGLKEKLKNQDNIIEIQKNKIENLTDEVQKLRAEKIIVIHFTSNDHKINANLAFRISDNFSQIEQKLYEKYSEYKGQNNTFTSNGKKIDKLKTLKENGIIIDGQEIILNKK